MEREGIVVRATAGFVDIDEDGERYTCKLRGRLKREKRKTDLCVIGDRVRFTPGERGPGTIEEVLPRRTVFSRQHPGPGGQYREDVLVANLDTLVVADSHGTPAYRPRMVDRFLVVAEYHDVRPIVVMNKADMREGGEDRLAPYAALGYETIHTSCKNESGLAALRDALGPGVRAFVGASGVGKSSLCNALDPALALRVRETSDAHGKGRHTTRVATLHPFAGGFIADTPGIRELAGFAIPDDALADAFVEFRPHIGQCGFRGCTHEHEPRCAVQAAVDEGAISEARYDSYLRLLLGDERPERGG